MKICKTCEEAKDLSSFPTSKRRSGSLYLRPHCYACKYKKEGRVPDKAYHKSYYYNNKLDIKYKAYRHSDKKFLCATVDMETAIELMLQSCHYCGKVHANGLDRLDSSQGHCRDNVVPCCEKCNYILGDLPKDAKALLKVGLSNIREKEMLKEWVIPTKRKKKL